MVELLFGVVIVEFIVLILFVYLDDIVVVVCEKIVEIVGRVFFNAARELSWYSEIIVNVMFFIKLFVMSYRWFDCRVYINICFVFVREVE